MGNGERRRRWWERYLPVLLLAWFLALDSIGVRPYLENPGAIGTDVLFYLRASAAWLARSDPWAVGSSNAHFAGNPATLQLFAPLTLVPERVALYGWLLACALCALYAIRRCRLPVWWLAFPPLVDCLCKGQPSIVVLALLLLPGPIGPAIGVAVKPFALLPILGERRWMCLAVGLALLAGSIVLAPDLWLDYVARLSFISSRLMAELAGGLSAWTVPWLVPPVALALVMIGRRDLRAAGWLGVISLWPAMEYHYGVFMLPVASAVLGAGVAVAAPGAGAVAVILEAGRRLLAATWARGPEGPVATGSTLSAEPPADWTASRRLAATEGMWRTDLSDRARR